MQEGYEEEEEEEKVEEDEEGEESELDRVLSCPSKKKEKTLEQLLKQQSRSATNLNLSRPDKYEQEGEAKEEEDEEGELDRVLYFKRHKKGIYYCNTFVLTSLVRTLHDRIEITRKKKKKKRKRRRTRRVSWRECSVTIAKNKIQQLSRQHNMRASNASVHPFWQDRDGEEEEEEGEEKEEEDEEGELDRVLDECETVASRIRERLAPLLESKSGKVCTVKN